MALFSQCLSLGSPICNGACAVSTSFASRFILLAVFSPQRSTPVSSYFTRNRPHILDASIIRLSLSSFFFSPAVSPRIPHCLFTRFCFTPRLRLLPDYSSSFHSSYGIYQNAVSYREGLARFKSHKNKRIEFVEFYSTFLSHHLHVRLQH